MGFSLAGFVGGAATQGLKDIEEEESRVKTFYAKELDRSVAEQREMRKDRRKKVDSRMEQITMLESFFGGDPQARNMAAKVVAGGSANVQMILGTLQKARAKLLYSRNKEPRPGPRRSAGGGAPAHRAWLSMAATLPLVSSVATTAPATTTAAPSASAPAARAPAAAAPQSQGRWRSQGGQRGGEEPAQDAQEGQAYGALQGAARSHGL